MNVSLLNVTFEHYRYSEHLLFVAMTRLVAA